LFRLTTPFALNLQLAGINSVRQKYGLEPFDDYLTAFTFGDRTLFVDVPSVAPVSRLRNSESYVGHVAWNSDAELPKWWDSLPRDRPLAYIALGSSGDLGAIPLVCKAVNQAGCLAVVSTADRFNSSDLPGDVYSAAFLPGDRVARRASLVVSNGGSPTSYQALEQGIPVLGIARNMDQLVCMANIQEVGAGLLLRADSLKQSSLNMAVERLVRERSFTTAARSLSQEFSEYDSAARLRDTILELSQAKRYRRMKTTAFASR
jgi:UDP:flavonoid glycosyltransferase YjiC (YdhE family)